MKTIKTLMFSVAGLTLLFLTGCNQGPMEKSTKKSDEPLVTEKAKIQQHEAYQANKKQNNNTYAASR